MGSKTLTQLAGEALMVLIPMILSLTVHEFSHGAVAYRLGDDTAEKSGRLTLNPISHIDPIGTVMLPFILLVAGNALGGFPIPFFGWAKPVPLNAGKFRRNISVRLGSTLVAAAGPLSNLLMALLCAATMSAAQHGFLGSLGQMEGVNKFFEYMTYINIGLFVFNLIPIYPLDGQKVVSGLMGPAQSLQYERFNQQYGVMALWAVILFAGRFIMYPVLLVATGVFALVGVK